VLLAAGLPDLGIEHPHRGVVDVKPVAAEDLGADALGERLERGGGLAAPVDERRAWDVHAVAGVDLALAVQRKVVVELRDEDVGEQARAGQPARDRARRRRRLHHPLAPSAGLLQPRGLGDRQLGGDEIEDLGHVLAHQPEIAAAVGAGLARIHHRTLARHLGVDPRLAAAARLAPLTVAILRPATALRLRGLGLGRGRRGLGHGHLQVLQRQLQLLDLARDLLRARAELLLFEPGDADLQRPDQRLVGPHRGRHPGGFLALGEDDRLQRGGIVRQGFGRRRHAAILYEATAGASFVLKSSTENQTTRAGGAVQAGRRQSIPSHNIASCAEVSRATPSAGDGQGKRPRSSTL